VHQIEFYIEAFCNIDKAIIQDPCEAQQMITVILKHFTNRTNPMRALRLEATQLLNNKVVEFVTFLQVGAGHGENVVIHPIHKNTDVVSPRSCLRKKTRGQPPLCGEPGPVSCSAFDRWSSFWHAPFWPGGPGGR